MKFRLSKKEYRGPARTCFKGGFALLFSVLVSSLLLTIGLSIFSIALKELAISTATRQSIHAFYAADSGREYIKYLDTKTYELFDYIPNISNSVSTSTERESNVGMGLGEANFKVTISKSKAVGVDKVTTTIISYGHDSNSGDKVERAIQQTY